MNNKFKNLTIETTNLSHTPDSHFFNKDERMQTRSNFNHLYNDFNNSHNERFFQENETIPRNFYLLRNSDNLMIPFNFEPSLLEYINKQPRETKKFAVFQFAELAGGKKRRKRTDNKKVFKKKTVKKKGGMMRRRPGAPGGLIDTSNGLLSNDTPPSSPEFILNAVPYHARSQDGSSIMISAPQSPQPAKYLRDVNVGRHFGVPPDKNLEYDWDMYIYDIISKELSEDQKNLMNTFINSKNFDIVNGWIMNNSIPKQFILYLPNMTDSITFKFKDIDSNALLRRCYNQSKDRTDPLCIMHYIFGSIILQRGSSYKNKIKNTKKNNIIKKKKVEKLTVKKQKVEKQKVEKKKVEKKKVEKKKVEKKKAKKQKVEKKKVEKRIKKK